MHRQPRITQILQFSCSVVSILWDSMDCSSEASLSITNAQSLLKLMSIESLMPSNQLASSSTFLLTLVILSFLF